MISANMISLDFAAQQSYNLKKEEYVVGTSTKVKNMLIKDLIALSLTNLQTSPEAAS